MTKIKHEPITHGIKHWGLIGYSNILLRTKFGVTGHKSSPQYPTISYRQPIVGLENDCFRKETDKQNLSNCSTDIALNSSFNLVHQF